MKATILVIKILYNFMVHNNFGNQDIYKKINQYL